jgi:hypothetical protein
LAQRLSALRHCLAVRCCAAIKVRTVLPHPGMLPNHGPVASQECSRSTVATPDRNTRSRCCNSADLVPLRNAAQLDRRRLNLGWRGPEHEFMCLVPTPDLEPTLQSPQESDWVGSGLFSLESLEQLTCGAPRLGRKPIMQLRRSRHQRIRTTPTTLSHLLGFAGRAYLALPPCCPQARQELL